MNRKGQEFTFPKNVNKEYGVIKEYTLKDILTIILPTIIIFGVFIVLALPTSIHSVADVVPLLIVVSLLCIVVTFELAIITVKPIKERPNITVKYYFISIRRKYHKMQKLYFLKPKGRRNIIDS